MSTARRGLGPGGAAAAQQRQGPPPQRRPGPVAPPGDGLRAVTALRLVPVPRGAVETALALARTVAGRGAVESAEVHDSASALVVVLEGVLGRRAAGPRPPAGPTVSGSGAAPTAGRG